MKGKVFTLGVAISLLVLVLVRPYVAPQFAILKVYADGTPDSYGNRILGVWVAEWNETLSNYQSPYKQCKILVTYDGTNTFDVFTIHGNGDQMAIFKYTSGVELKVYGNQKCRIIVVVAANKTLISDPEPETRVYLNITGVVTNQLMTYQTSAEGTNYYKITYYYDWTSNLPSEGTSYAVAIKFEVYY